MKSVVIFASIRMGHLLIQSRAGIVQVNVKLQYGRRIIRTFSIGILHLNTSPTVCVNACVLNTAS